MTSLIEHSIQLIRDTARESARPAVMLSFGKDSMVMAHLIREALLSRHGLNGTHFPSAHGFPLPVIYHRDPWFPIKHEFAEHTARMWGMEVHDYTPVCAGVKTNEKMIELVARYAFGDSFMDIPKNTLHPNPRRDYICGLNDWLARPKTAIQPYPWDLVFIGHKSSDVDPFEGHVPLNTEMTELGKVRIVFPLKDWTDENVWDYIELHSIATQATRYEDRREVDDKWYNNDYINACTNCIDPRNKGDQQVFCPKLKRNVPNVGHRVLVLRAKPDFIERED